MDESASGVRCCGGCGGSVVETGRRAWAGQEHRKAPPHSGPRSVAARLCIALNSSFTFGSSERSQVHFSGCVSLLPIRYAILLSISTFVNDMLIILAISYRLKADAVTAERG